MTATVDDVQSTALDRATLSLIAGAELTHEERLTLVRYVYETADAREACARVADEVADRIENQRRAIPAWLRRIAGTPRLDEAIACARHIAGRIRGKSPVKSPEIATPTGREA